MQNIDQLFEQQVDTLVEKELHLLTGQSEADFRNELSFLKKNLAGKELFNLDFESGVIPFLIIVPQFHSSIADLMKKVIYYKKSGIEKMFPHISEEFSSIEGIEIPEKPYVLINIDRGGKYLNVRPTDALVAIIDNSKTPLTIIEGIFLLLYYPEMLIKNNCFSLLGSRIKDNKRVPALWINAKKEPNLGWCWAGNPHTWLGSAFAQSRV